MLPKQKFLLKKKYKEDWPDKVNEANKYFAVPWPLKKINDKLEMTGPAEFICEGIWLKN